MNAATLDVQSHPLHVRGCAFDLEAHVRTILRSPMLAVGLAVVLAACGKNSASPNRAMNDDLKRDLQLASSSSLDLASQQASKSFALTEIGQSSVPSPSLAVRKGAGPKAVKSKAPTVKAAPAPTVDTKAEEPTTQVMAQAPSPTTEPTPDPTAPAVPRPSPTPIDPNGGEGAHGQNGGGSNPGAGDGGGSILGGIFGAIIRGGVVDGDHCDPRTDRRGRGRGNYPNTPFPPPGRIPPRIQF
jgi:hypothetical protein